MTAEKSPSSATHSPTKTADTESSTAKTFPVKRWMQAFRADTWVRPFLKQYKKALLVSLGLGVAAMVFAAALMFTSGYLISISADRPEMGVYAISAVLGFVQIFGIGKPFLSYFERLASHDWVLRLTSTLRKRLFTSFNAQGVLHSASRKAGEALGLLSEDIGHLQNMYLRVIFPQIIAAAIAVLLTLALGVFSPLLGLAVLALMFTLVALVPLASVLVNGGRRMASKQSRNRQYDTALDNVTGLADWEISGRRDDFIDAMTAEYAQTREAERAAAAFDRKRDFLVQALFCLLVVIVFTWAGIYFGDVAQSAAATGDTSRPVNWVAAFVLGLFPLVEAFAPLSNAAVEMDCHLDSMNRISDAAQEETVEDNAGTFSPDQLASYDICLSDVSFHHPESNQAILRNVSLAIPQGRKVALLGPSGTGKSTLAWLIRGDLAPTTGTLTIGGVPTCQLSDSHKVFGFIQQSPYLFNKTLGENLRLGNPKATDEELIAALEAVELGDLFASLPKGLKTMVDEGGLRFSGGERHRIALARILLADTPVVILDEPTVSLDPRTEHQLLQTVFSVLQGRTIIMITHQKSGLGYVDEVLHLQDGELTRA